MTKRIVLAVAIGVFIGAIVGMITSKPTYYMNDISGKREISLYAYERNTSRGRWIEKTYNLTNALFVGAIVSSGFLIYGLYKEGKEK